MLKRYIVFVFNQHEQEGGWNDVLNDDVDETGKLLVRSFDTPEEASAASNTPRYCGSIIQIVDLHSGQVVDKK